MKVSQRDILLLEGFGTPHRLYRDSIGEGIMLYVGTDKLSNLLAFEGKPIESLFIELNLQNTKILINCSYNPHKSEIKKHLAALRNSLDLHFLKYEKF